MLIQIKQKMSKNKKARITLEFAIGIVLSILILIAVINIVGGLFRLNNDSRQSFYKLVSLIKDVSDDPAGTVKTTALRMDKETVIIGFTKDDKPFTYLNMKAIAEGGHIANYDFDKPTGFGCEENEACICLYRELYKKDGKLKFKEKSLICESLDNVEFPNLPQEDPFYYQGNGFVISRSEYFTSEEHNPQFRTVFVEKYKGPSGEMVAVCENPEGDSCVSRQKEEDLVINKMKIIEEIIKSCSEKEFLEEPCSCGAYDFENYMKEGYFIDIKKEDDNLIMVLHYDQTIEGIGFKDLEKVELKTDILCKIEYSNNEIKVTPNKITKLRLWYDLNGKDDYSFYSGSGNIKLAFIKYNNNVCLAHHDNKRKHKWTIEEDGSISIVVDSNEQDKKYIKACFPD